MPSFGVIAPYADLSAKYSANISVTFVDGFQGQERDVVIFSATRSNSAGNIGFLADHNRLNVAIMRPNFRSGSSYRQGSYRRISRKGAHENPQSTQISGSCILPNVSKTT
ncbi:AAA domain-containing protein [Jimgerdemannia flammicorona]|uniref:AAA domain-containing protein n=1 Tax=Jimgerdemannia flammicorona TaxID=994334 RepID=A0A433BAL7_9FUNG|nr:AAA domain-containing protein [Jimgerdemannia flammicorona]